ncbi:MAG: 4-hydroxythreonine-4-phosphate dehydrogenase PdxA [Gemmatimonadota bacterium]|jgi:4-hydroxythreonine-4-phosphate dehydrogenase
MNGAGALPGGTLRIAVTLGDPRGIGPEVMPQAVRAILRQSAPPSLFLLGPEGLDPGLTPYLAIGSWDGTETGAGRITAAAIEKGIQMAEGGSIGALVTGPSHKPALRAAGWDVPGQTEMLQRLTGAADVGMLMCAEETALGAPLRVLLATTHLPLRDLFNHLTPELLVRQTTLLVQALKRDWKIEAPSVGLCAVNPHAGDGGLFGNEEEVIYGPALEELRERGFDVQGPFPADTVFRRALDGRLDAVVAPYHDVGMAAFKSVSFGTGVNVTLGLPLIRTSPDHGTAFDIVGSGKADFGSAREAVRLAAWLAGNRFDTPQAQG